ncbi:peptide/nickel transport system permease protein [Rhodoligotrophos appendicifer]|uniref:ABC transporter permease n=1 Tax=Rhodoligotrophos appendicifer TaxID=987056 RepID=UPI001960CD71|nr:ABC transporter permease [Rhodoligotrophos appendicifer]
MMSPGLSLTLGARWPVHRIVGVTLMTAIFAFAFLTPLFWPVDPTRQSLRNVLVGPNWAEPLGYDHLGRSMLARLSAALRLSLGLAFLSVFTAAVPGVALGILAAWKGGLVDRAVSLLADVFLALPGLLLVLMLSAIVPNSPAMLYVGISLVLWIEYFRLTRALTRTLVTAPAVQASRLLGFGRFYIFRRHLWPEIGPLLLTVGAFGAATAIMAIAALGFVSVGVRPPTPELGLMMIELLPYYQEAPHALLQPILVLFLLVLSLNLIGGSKQR